MSTPAPPNLKPDFVSLALVGLLLLTAVFLGWQELRGDDAILPAGEQAPDFSFRTAGGQTVTRAGLEGRVVVIDFWATWCPPCREEMPWLVELGKELDHHGGVLIAASQDDQDEQVELVREFAKNVPGLEHYAAYSTPEMGKAFRVSSLPTLFIIDKHGKVVFSKAGLANEEAIRSVVEEAVEAR